MDALVDRPHRTISINSASTSTNIIAPTAAATSNDLFICFTSRLSSSSMKIPSKSILSPGRARDHPQISLSSSLSRRLRSNGSLKGGQASPMFPATGKKRGSAAFENPEPSSPKVTCIGQVRVKTKKQGKKLRARSSSRRGKSGGEASFRRLEINAAGTDASDSNALHHAHHRHQPQQQQQQLQSGWSCSSNSNSQDCSAQRNQRWVHFPVTICEALRTFGAEWNCFLPCRSSCTTTTTTTTAKDKMAGSSGDGGNGGSGNSCGAVIARWLVALHEGEGKERQVEIIVGDGDEEREREVEREERSGSYRRRIFEGVEFNEDEIRRVRSEGAEGGEIGDGVSVCVPPKNALLLMRCRSDPVKMAALASRFCEAPPVVVDDEEEDDENGNSGADINTDEVGGGVEVKRVSEGEVEKAMEDNEEKSETVSEKWVTADASLESCRVQDGVSSLTVDPKEREEEDAQVVDQRVDEQLLVQVVMEEDDDEDEVNGLKAEDEDGQGEGTEAKEVRSVEETKLSAYSLPVSDQETSELSEKAMDDEARLENGSETDDAEDGENDLGGGDDLGYPVSVQLDQEPGREESQETEAGVYGEAALSEEKGTVDETRDLGTRATLTREGFEPEDPMNAAEAKSMDRDVGQQQKVGGGREAPVLPDCLLLMMCEPKLSMEVSKETWVCSTDFVRWLPERRGAKVSAKNVGGGKDKPEPSQELEKRINRGDAELRRTPAAALTAQQAHILQQPPRNSCSFPAQAAAVVAAARAGANAESMAAVIEQKLVSSKGYEPFVLSRCKSEPMRTAIKLAPDACFWKNRKLEPHRRSTIGVKAAGVGC